MAGNPNWGNGVSGNPNGRKNGSINKSTEQIKRAYTELVEGNLDNIQEWLNRVATTDPKGALDFLIKLSPFVIPKKTETDITIDNPLKIVIPPKEDDSK